MVKSIDKNKAKRIYDLFKTNPNKIFNIKNVVEGIGINYKETGYANTRPALEFLFSLGVIQRCKINKVSAGKGYMLKETNNKLHDLKKKTIFSKLLVKSKNSTLEEDEKVQLDFLKEQIIAS